MLRTLAIALAALITGTNLAATQTKVALVLGVRDYEYLRPLKRSPNDANDMAALFRREGYHKVFSEPNARDVSVMRNTIDDLVLFIASKANNGANVNVVIYYSGHGVEAYGNNWLLGPNFKPVEKKKPGHEAYKKYGIQLSDVLSKLKNAGAKATVVILDACREPSVELGPSKLVSPSFNLLPPASGMRNYYALYGAAQSSVSYDNYDGETSKRNSVFTSFFLELAKDKNIELSQYANILQVKVEQATKNKKPMQTPAVYDQMSGDYYLFGEKESYVNSGDRIMASAPKPPGIGGQNLQLSLEPPTALQPRLIVPDALPAISVAPPRAGQTGASETLGDWGGSAYESGERLQQGAPVTIFFRHERLADAQKLAERLAKEGLFYAMAADDLATIRAKLAPGSYRIVREETLSPAEEQRFDWAVSALTELSGGKVVVTRLPSNKILHKPFQIQLF